MKTLHNLTELSAAYLEGFTPLHEVLQDRYVKSVAINSHLRKLKNGRTKYDLQAPFEELAIAPLDGGFSQLKQAVYAAVPNGDVTFHYPLFADSLQLAQEDFAVIGYDVKRSFGGTKTQHAYAPQDRDLLISSHGKDEIKNYFSRHHKMAPDSAAYKALLDQLRQVDVIAP
jgi:hypothetical protein